MGAAKAAGRKNEVPDEGIIPLIFFCAEAGRKWCKMITVDNADELARLLEDLGHRLIEEVLENEVFDVVRDTMLDRVQKDVYDFYSGEDIPKEYIRRKTNQGLADPTNVVSEIVGKRGRKTGRKLRVWNIAKKNPSNNPNQFFSADKKEPDSRELLQPLIIKGWGSATKTSPAYMQPRPFIKSTSEELRGGAREKLDGAFREGMEQRGREKGVVRL